VRQWCAGRGARAAAFILPLAFNASMMFGTSEARKTIGEFG